MAIAPIKLPTIRDPDDQFQRDARKAVRTLDAPGTRKVTLSKVVLGVTTVKVPHQLGRIPTGWLIIDRNANAVVWRDTSATNDYLPLKASATVTVDIQVW
jgi:hypothetical protein